VIYIFLVGIYWDISMKTDKTSVIVSKEESKHNDAKNAQLTADFALLQKATETAAHKKLFNLTQQFGLEASLLPSEKQMPIEERSIKRSRLESHRKQQNIEAIMEKTYAFCSSKTIDKRTDLDWFNRFIHLAEDISNNTMQDLWAKILAGELSKPGTFSLKALKVFRDMSIVDAKLLAKACSLAVKDSTRKNIRLLSGSCQPLSLLNFFNKQRQQFFNLSNFGLNYADLLSLADNHLIFFQESESTFANEGQTANFTYNGQPLKLASKKPKTSLQFYKFTPIGAELAQLIGDKSNDDFFTHLKEMLNHHFEIANSE